MNALGDTIRRLRLARGWTQEQLEEHAGVSQQALSQIESGKVVRPSDENMRKLAEALGVRRRLLYIAADLIESDEDIADDASPDDPVGVLMEYLRNDPSVMLDLAQAKAELRPEEFEEVLRDVAEAHKSNLVMGLKVARRAALRNGKTEG